MSYLVRIGNKNKKTKYIFFERSCQKQVKRINHDRKSHWGKIMNGTKSQRKKTNKKLLNIREMVCIV